MQAVEHLGYRVTVGDVATQAGLNALIWLSKELVTASDTGGHLQVSLAEICSVSQNFRTILRNKFLRCSLRGKKKSGGVFVLFNPISLGVLLLSITRFFYRHLYLVSLPPRRR